MLKYVLAIVTGVAMIVGGMTIEIYQANAERAAVLSLAR